MQIRIKSTSIKVSNELIILGCNILTAELDKKEIQPLILNEKFEFFYPQDGIEIKVPKNNKLFISCVDDNNFKQKTIKSSVINITCLENDMFFLEKDIVKITDLSCKKYPKSTARRTKKKCGKAFEEIEIGYSVANQFVRVLEVCFDSNLQTTLFSRFMLTKWISNLQKAGRINWKNDLYSLNSKEIDMAYSKKCQKKHINSLLQLPGSSNEVVKNDNRHFLSRGHLAAKADFYFVHQQTATFFTLNAAPQWQTFNNGNWKTLEIALRKFAATRKLDLEIYTGTYKILEMTTTETKSKVKISLLGNDTFSSLPVPLFFWKIVYEPKSQNGVAFVGVNNPYITQNDMEDLQICLDITEKVSWVKFVKHNLVLGYSYACNLNNFLKIVRYAPRLKVKNVLE